MSNQVYSNDKSKYIEQRGVVLYSLTNDAITNLDGLKKLTWAPQLIQDDKVVSISAINDTFTALKDGIYTISINLTFVDSVSPATNIIQTDVQIVAVKNGLGPLTVSSDLSRYYPLLAMTGNTGASKCLTASIYLQGGESFYVQVASLSPTGITFRYSNIFITLQ